MKKGNKKGNQGKVSLLVVPAADHDKLLMRFLKKRNVQGIGYITSNKGSGAVKEGLRKYGISGDKVLLVDCISKTIGIPKKAEDVIFVPSPSSLTTISITMKKMIKAGMPLIVIDSLSTLSVYNRDKLIIKFIHDVINTTHNQESSSLIVVVSQKDSKTRLYDTIEAMVDNVLTL